MPPITQAPAFLHTSGDLQVDRRYEYAKALEAEGDLEAAIDLLSQTAADAPAWPVLPFTLGQLYRRMGSDAQARACFEHCLALDPTDHQGVKLEMQLLDGNHEAGMPPAFVAGLFDQYAHRFDNHLTGTLKYNVPYQILNLVERTKPNFKAKRILDLGCGTGLAAEQFKTHAEYIEGVDLSSGMLEEARKKSIYNNLVCDELLNFLQTTNLKFNLILAADVLTYLGDLGDLFKTIRPHLKADGLLSFSVQKLDDASKDFTLGETHRYSHTARYLNQLLTDAGLVTLAQEEQILRQDRGEDVPGYIYLCTIT